jgi:hypothetical protein
MRPMTPLLGAALAVSLRVVTIAENFQALSAGPAAYPCDRTELSVELTASMQILRRLFSATVTLVGPEIEQLCAISTRTPLAVLAIVYRAPTYPSCGWYLCVH